MLPRGSAGSGQGWDEERVGSGVIHEGTDILQEMVGDVEYDEFDELGRMRWKFMGRSSGGTAWMTTTIRFCADCIRDRMNQGERCRR